jgi:predicted negative regulator of RcsB-dependent stress response
MTTQTTTPDQTKSETDEILKQTELGEFIANNKALVFGLLALIIIALFGNGFYREYKDKVRAENAAKINTFINTKFEDFKGKKLDGKTFITDVRNLNKDLGNDIAILPLILFGVEEFEKRADANSAMELLTLAPKMDNPYSEFFYMNKKVEILEDLGKFQEALNAINTLSPKASMLLEEKVFLDKGRLFLKMGNTAEAKKNFELVTGKVGQEDFVKLARIYLAEIEAKTGK